MTYLTHIADSSPIAADNVGIKILGRLAQPSSGYEFGLREVPFSLERNVVFLRVHGHIISQAPKTLVKIVEHGSERLRRRRYFFLYRDLPGGCLTNWTASARDRFLKLLCEFRQNKKSVN